MRQAEYAASKMEGNESIILQMNKERLRLERQLSLLMKASFMLFDYSCYFPKPKKNNINHKYIFGGATSGAVESV